jgi:hypothetical protein
MRPHGQSRKSKSIKESPGLSPGALCRIFNYRFEPKLKFILDAIKNSIVADGTVRHEAVSASNADSTL